MSNGFSGGAFSAGGGYSDSLLFTREGLYRYFSASTDVYFPPDITNLSDTVSLGCLLGEGADVITTEELGGLNALSLSTGSYSAVLTPGLSLSVGPSTGFSVFTKGPGGGVAPAFQYDVTVSSVAVGFIPLPGGIRYQVDSGFINPPVLLQKFPGGCSVNAGTPYASAEGEDLGTGALREAASEAVQPLVEHLSAEEGFGPGVHTMAGSNADAIASFGGPGFGHAEGYPSSTLDDFVDQLAAEVDASADDADLAALGARHANELENVFPNRPLLHDLMQRAAVALPLLREANRQERDTTGLVAQGLVIIEQEVQQPVNLVVEAREITDLLLLPSETPLDGVQLHISASHTLNPSDHAITDTQLSLTFTPKTTAPMLLTLTASFEEAVSPALQDYADQEVVLKPRLILPTAGPAAGLELGALSKVASGGSATINVAIRDAQGNLVNEPADVSFYDAHGDLLGTAPSEGGVASLPFVPRPTTPSIHSVREASLPLDDGSTVPGLVIEGTGFSRAGKLLINGMTPNEGAVEVRRPDSQTIEVLGITEPVQSLEFRNPGDLGDHWDATE